MKTILGLSLGLALTLSGCGKEEAPAPEAVPTPAPMPAPPAPPPAPELSDDDVAVPEDFIEQATADVTPANYKATLDGIDQEMAAEPE